MMMMSVVPKSRKLCRGEFKANSKSPFDFRKSISFSTETRTRGTGPCRHETRRVKARGPSHGTGPERLETERRASTERGDERERITET